MNRLVRVSLAVILLACAPALFADGGGGMFLGYQISQYPLLEEYPIENNTLGLIYYGGFGYGVSYHMSRLFTDSYHRSDYLNSVGGGFGFVLMDAENPENIIGGFGGVIAGLRLIKRPLNISILTCTGFGGIATGRYSYFTGGYKGLFVVSEEITLEVGLPLIDWFMPTAYAGYQIIGNVVPGRLFETFLSYTPVAGIRIQFGDFL